jgi:hypothetical protein
MQLSKHTQSVAGAGRGGWGAAAGARWRGAELGGEELGEERNERADEVHKCSGSL